MFDPVLVISLATICSGIVILSLRLCFKSKCSDVTLCAGMITFHRDIAAEVVEDIAELNQNKKSPSNKDLTIV